MSKKSEILATLGDEKRLKIVELLSEKSMTVLEIADAVGTSQPNISQHLLKMFHVKLLSKKRKGQKIYYTLEKKRVLKILKSITEIVQGGDGKNNAVKKQSRLI